MGDMPHYEIPGNTIDLVMTVYFFPPSFFSANQHFYPTISFHPGTGVCEINSGCVLKRLQSVESQIAQGFPPPAPCTQTPARQHIKTGPAGL